jgi:predicted cobalt transporter CbtA
MLNARTFLLRGLLAGLLAGFVAFGVAYVLGEPSVNAAIAIEEAASQSEPGQSDPSQSDPSQSDHGQSYHTHADDTAPGEESAEHSHGEETEVPRSLQSTLGLLTGTLVAGTVLGGLLGVISALALGRLGGLSSRASTLSVAGLGFVSVYLVPFIGYPPNPPAVGHGETIGYRTALYFILLAVSVIAMITAVLVGRRLAARIGGWHAALVCGLGYLVVVGVAIGLMPTYDEVPAGFPASLLYEFRVGSLATQLALWATLAVVLAEFVDRLTRAAATVSDRVPVSVP